MTAPSGGRPSTTPSTAETATTWLPRAAAIEVISIVVLFANRASTQVEEIASAVGPLHGMAYLATIACAWLAPLNRGSKYLSIVPGLGGYMALAHDRRRQRSMPGTTASKEIAIVSVARAGPTRHGVRSEGPGPDHGEASRLRDGLEPPALVADELVKSYGPQVQIGPISFSVASGSITGLVGPNGVGKTTTIRMLLGLVRPDSGSLTLLGVQPSDLPMAREQVGAMVEAPALIDTLSGRDNLRLLARLAGWDDDRVDEALTTVGLAARAGAKVGQYSLGMRQRLGLAAAMLGRPHVLILDEPANGLDPQGAAQLRTLLRSIADAGTTVVVSSHVLSEIEQVCDHLVVLAASGIVFSGPREELRARQKTTLLVDTEDEPSRRELREVLRRHDLDARTSGDGAIVVTIPLGPAPARRGRSATSSNQFERGYAQEGLRVPTTDPTAGTATRWAAQVNQWALEGGIVLSRLHHHRSSLEDVFFDLTGEPGSSGDRLGDVLDAGTRAGPHHQDTAERPPPPDARDSDSDSDSEHRHADREPSQIQIRRFGRDVS